MTRPVSVHASRLPAGVARLLLTLILVASFSPGRAEARPRPTGGKPFSANKTFGVGLILLEPVGLCAKYYLSPTTALDFAFGEFDRFGDDDDDLGVHVDYLWHPFVLATADPFVVPLYIGLGGRITDDDDGQDDDVSLGVRGAFGVELDFNRIPLDVFFELAIIIELVNDEGEDDVQLDPAIGVRYYF